MSETWPHKHLPSPDEVHAKLVALGLRNPKPPANNEKRRAALTRAHRWVTCCDTALGALDLLDAAVQKIRHFLPQDDAFSADELINLYWSFDPQVELDGFTAEETTNLRQTINEFWSTARTLEEAEKTFKTLQEEYNVFSKAPSLESPVLDKILGLVSAPIEILNLPTQQERRERLQFLRDIPHPLPSIVDPSLS